MTRSHRTRFLAACTALLLVVQAVWSLANPNAAEGPTLITFTHDHGLTVGDLLGVALLLIALALWFAVVFAPTEAVEGRSPLPDASPAMVPSTREEHRGGPSWSSARTSSS